MKKRTQQYWKKGGTLKKNNTKEHTDVAYSKLIPHKMRNKLRNGGERPNEFAGKINSINKTRRFHSSSLNRTSNIVKKFMEMLNCIKLFHWQTRSFAKHKASDELYSELNENVDKFVETLLGKQNSRIKHLEKRLVLYNECINGNDSIKTRIFEFCDFLEDMNSYFDKDKDSDILTIRDEILVSLHKFMYLLSLH
jgi:DNA-binding ferritin-like protein